VATTPQSKLNKLYSQVSPGRPISSEELSALGISADLAVHYARSGWLTRLARGVYSRPGESLKLEPSLLLLQRKVVGLHVGGKSALTWHGITQYVQQRATLHLFGWSAAKLPDWFLQHFPAEYHQKRLFKEKPTAMLHVARFEQRPDAPHVSSAERALLELLSEVGVRQPLQEARELAESTYTLRAEVLQQLLSRCTNVKTVRLCLQLGKELSLPWSEKLDRSQLPTGSDKPWVSRSKEGLLILKP